MKAENPHGASTEKPQTLSKPEVPVETFPPFPQHGRKCQMSGQEGRHAHLRGHTLYLRAA